MIAEFFTYKKKVFYFNISTIGRTIFICSFIKKKKMICLSSSSICQSMYNNTIRIGFSICYISDPISGIYSIAMGDEII